MDLQIRERLPNEIPLQVEIENAASPPDWHTTVEETKNWESLAQPEDLRLHLLAFHGERAVAHGAAAQRSFGVPGRFGIGIQVIPEWRRRGIARQLYGRLVAFALDHSAETLQCSVRETELHRVASWLDCEGFIEVYRMRESELSLEAFDPQSFHMEAEKTRASGISLITLADDDSEENRRKLWELVVQTDRDIPWDTEHLDEPFDRFVDEIEAPHCLRDCLVIARDGDQFVGYTMVGRQTAERAFTWGTGVHAEYRNRGIALVMKVRSAILVRDRGYQAMRTFNHRNNPAMLAVNNRLGYRALPEVLTFLKTVERGG